MSFGLAAVRDCLFDSLAAVAGVFELVKIDVVGHRLNPVSRMGAPHAGQSGGSGADTSGLGACGCCCCCCCGMCPGFAVLNWASLKIFWIPSKSIPGRSASSLKRAAIWTSSARRTGSVAVWASARQRAASSRRVSARLPIGLLAQTVQLEHTARLRRPLAQREKAIRELGRMAFRMNCRLVHPGSVHPLWSPQHNVVEAVFVPISGGRSQGPPWSSVQRDILPTAAITQVVHWRPLGCCHWITIVSSAPQLL